MWKAISGITNHRISTSIQLHNALHGFRAGRGTGTTTLEANMVQKLITMRETILHSILLDLRKAYDALDRYRCLDILAGYVVGPRMLRILQTYWDRLHMAAETGGHYSPIFQRHRVVTQGNPLLPTIFNVVVDAVIKKWLTVVGLPQEDIGQGLGESIQTLTALFYADDVIVASPENARLQGAFNVLTGLFD